LQPPSVQTTASLANLETALSAERFATSLAAIGGDRALALYEWNGVFRSKPWRSPTPAVANARCSSARVSRTIRASSPSIRDSPTPLPRPRLRSINAPIETSRLLAELSFGCWTSRFGHHVDRTLWVPGRYRAFPHVRRVTGTPIRRPTVAKRFQYLRNQIAHHAPIFTRSLSDDHESLLEVAGRMDPDLRAWIASVSTLPRLLAVWPQFTP